MGISDKIEAFICELFKNEQKDYLELGRNELAEIFDCVPSQINYVLNTRFNSDHGYIVESRRGGGGYLRIYKISATDRMEEIHELLNSPLTFKQCNIIIKNLYDYSVISENTAKIMLAAVSDKSIPPEKDLIRTKVLKNMIYAIN